MPAQRTRSSVAPDHRSAHPNLPGVPWWGAVLIAVIGTTIGFAVDAGSADKELGGVFAAMYALGCLAAALAVRHSSIFTAVIQPPLILFVAVPGAYFLFHGAELTGMKDTLINYGYPLIERFPLMLFTSAAVLLVGMARWYFTLWSLTRPQTVKDTAEPTRSGGVAAKLGALFGGASAGDSVEDKPKRKHGIDRAARAEHRADKPARSARSSTRTSSTRSRHARPPVDDVREPAAERPRRQTERRPRPPGETDSRTPPPRRAAPPRRESYGPRPSRYQPYEPYEPYSPPPRPRDSGTHHPVSRVRYRDSGEDGDRRGETRSRHRRSTDDWDDQVWRYDH